jgi:hypothetical protein
MSRGASGVPLLILLVGLLREAYFFVYIGRD